MAALDELSFELRGDNAPLEPNPQASQLSTKETQATRLRPPGRPKLDAPTEEMSPRAQEIRSLRTQTRFSVFMSLEENNCFFKHTKIVISFGENKFETRFIERNRYEIISYQNFIVNLTSFGRGFRKF